MPLAIKLFFSGLLERLLKVVSAVLEWLLSDWRHAALTAVSIFALWLYLVLLPNYASLLDDAIADTETAIAERDAAIEERQLTMDAYEQTVANYIAAAAIAQAQAEANVARVEAEQAQITQETIDDYEMRLRAARARADELRRASIRAAELDPGRANAADLSGSATATRGADEAASDPGLPSAAGSCPANLVCLTIDQALIATEQAIQLDALISWSLRQAEVSNMSEASDDE